MKGKEVMLDRGNNKSKGTDPCGKCKQASVVRLQGAMGRNDERWDWKGK